ncbi:MAG: AAA family ATPase [Candidatus Pacebacteria bacterium]|nr:AAA family ATPase [Candidatus Paceibacterota bacterium]
MIMYITGSIGAGKGEAVNYLCEKYGFDHYSFRKFFSHELALRGLPNDRPHMINLADEIRATKGTSYVVSTLTEQARASGNNAVIESIRNLGEVEYVKSQPDTLLIAVDAPVRIRYERNKLRATSLDPQSFEDFIRDEKREMENTDPWRNNIVACIALADYVYENKGTLEELHAWIDYVLSEAKILTNK